MNYYIKIATINKAKKDIDTVVEQLGYANLSKVQCGDGGIGRFLTKLLAMVNILTTLKRDDVLFLQYPMKKFYKMACTLAHLKGAKVVTVIHDLGAFRRHKLTPEQENRLFSKTDFLIAHNPTMTEYLQQHGFQGGVHHLGIFDYLSAKPVRQPNAQPHDPWRIVYAGNLGVWRNEFLYHLDTAIKHWTLDLYGKGFEPKRNNCQKLTYHGFIDSDEFIERVDADFGLVWDGASVDECNGAWGEYLKINNPHKTSFYLRAGIPVIVWSKSAMAPFIRKNGLGLTVDSLAEIDSHLEQLTPEQYQAMRANAYTIGQKLATGSHIKRGLDAAQEYFKEHAE